MEQISSDQLHVICDTMLQGLGKSLRRCGIDTAILENHEDHMQSVLLAQNQGRYILTRGIAFKKVCSKLSKGK